MHHEALKMLRKEKGLTQAEMAEMLDVSRQSYIAWEKGVYQMPSNIEAQLAAAGMATRSSEKLNTKTINRNTHPHCWLARKGWYWTLAHPFWWASSDFPLSHIVPQSETDKASRLPTMAEYLAHKAPAPESVFELMVSHGAPRNAILTFMVARGYHQFGEPQETTPAMAAYKRDRTQFEKDHPGAGWALFEELYPQHRTAPISQPAAELDPDLKQAFETAFNLKTAKD